MVVQHNIHAVNSNGHLEKNVAGIKKASKRLSSGYRINTSSDDAAGLAVSEKMRSQLRGLKQSIRNSQDGISLVQTFEGALGETVSIIHRLGELATQSANGTYDNPTDRTAIQMEFRQLTGEINQLADTDFNGLCMLNNGKMADGFTFVSESGTMWLTPSEMSFPEDGFVNTFREVEGFPEMNMYIDINPDVKGLMTKDIDLMKAFSRMNGLSVRSFYNNGVPDFSLVGLEAGEESIFSIETDGYSATISITTPRSGKVPVATVSGTEMPHYASSTGTGKWLYSSVATGTYTKPDPATPGNEAFDLSKYEESYVDSSSATRAERQAYIDWIKATDAKGTLVNDTLFDKDTDPLKFEWSIDGNTYENALSASGVPETVNNLMLPVYSDTSNGPQIFLKNPHFYADDEDFKPGENVNFSLYDTTRSFTIRKTNSDGRTVTAGTAGMAGNQFYLNTWLDYGNKTVTLTYDKASNMWYDDVNSTPVLHNASYYGITDRYYSSGSRWEKENLYHFYEADGRLPDKFTFKITLDTPYYRTIGSSELQFALNQNNDDFKMGEFDPANPAAGGIDYMLAKHGATYIYDGLTQPDGTVGAWRNEAGEAVNLEDEGIHLPTKLNSTYTLPFYDGMTITVSNPTMVGEDYIQSRLLVGDPFQSANAYKKIYDNITWSEKLVLQVGARTKDGVEFTFNYNSAGMGDLEKDLDCTADGLGISRLSLDTQSKANEAIDGLGYALNKVSMIRASFGAIQNRLEHKIIGNTVTYENITESESGIRDTDMAQEMASYTKSNIIQQAAQSMLAQANQLPQSFLQLLG